jgi:hypothetical protein
MDETFDVLGPAEKHIAEQIRMAIAAAKTEAQNLLDVLDEIPVDAIEDAMVDAEKKMAVITLVDPIQKLASNLSMSSLLPLVMSVMLKPKTPTS